MQPQAILKQLSNLRWRERWTRLAWGLCRFVAVAIVVLTLACLLDWWIDRRQDTPWALRVVLLVGQVALWTGLGLMWVIRPQAQRLRDDDLALWVESRLPQFGHRLISAVQLNRPDADTKGMSQAMIAAVTREAEQQAEHLQFTDLCDRRRWKWGLGLMLPVLAVAALLALAAGSVTHVLLARQFLADREIPRNLALRSISARVWPSGELVELDFEVVAEELDADLVGEVQISPLGRAVETYPLVWNNQRGYFSCKIPPGATNFTYRAWLGDGRTREVSEVVYVARPAVVRQDAWLLLPEYCGLRPDGRRYEQPQPRAEIVGFEACQARVAVAFDKPVVKGSLQLFNRPAPEILAAWQPLGLGTSLPADALGQVFANLATRQMQKDDVTARAPLGPELPCREIPLVLHDVGNSSVGNSIVGSSLRDLPTAEAIFDLHPEETAYRIRITDEHGFDNARPTRRTINVLPDEPPRVTLLPERFAPPLPPLSKGGTEGGLAEDVEVENMPLPIGEAIQVSYSCRDALGLDRADFRYRVNDGPWRRLPLREIVAQPRLGPFDIRRGTFVKAGDREQVHFHAMPSPAIELTPGRLEGGGHFDFQTRALPGIKIGDRIEFFVEVYDRNPTPDRSPGRSEVRKKNVVTEQQFKDWVYRTLQHERRIRELEQKQRGVFDAEKKPR
jgi:hypothetical protein